MKKLWIFFGEGTPQKKYYLKSAEELNINYEYFDVPFFKFKGKKFFYKGVEIKELPDVVLIRCIDVAIEIMIYNFFKKHNIYVVNSKECHKNCEDKFATYRLMKSIGVTQPKTILTPAKLGYDKLSQKLGMPFIIKSRWGSRGSDVCLIKTISDYEKACQKIEASQMLAQEYVKNSFGKELRTYVIGDRVAGAIMRTNEKDFRSNVDGSVEEQVEISGEVEKLCVNIAKTLKGESISVDFLVDGEKLIFLEANVTPAISEAIRLGIPLDVYNLKYIMNLLK